MPSYDANISQGGTTPRPAQAQNGTSPAFIHSKLDELKLTPVQFRVYCHATRRAGGADGMYFESVPNCARHCKIRIPTARKAIAKLVDLGLLKLLSEPTGETKTYRVTFIEEWPPLPIGYPGIQTGGVSKREGSPTNRIPSPQVSKWEATPTNRVPPKVIPLSLSLEGNPMKGEAAPASTTPEPGKISSAAAPVPRLSAAERISFEGELVRVRERIRRIRECAAQDAMGKRFYTQGERSELDRAKAREKELMAALGQEF